ncbi:hypothetical protein FJY63_05465 [Candidatus Sumerlaeota bacterium]|nr:hypothetical protein [Candidatus Sumerlaeota bacterium]
MVMNQLARTVIPKITVAVVVRTAEHRIEGLMHVLYNRRVSDELNSAAEAFIPITKARIYDLDSNTLERESDFIALNKKHVIYVHEVGPRTVTQEGSSEESAPPPAADQQPGR